MKLFYSILAAVMLMSFSSCSKRSQFEREIAQVNAQCPIELEDGMTLAHVVDDGDNVLFIYKVDENDYDLDLIKGNASAVKAEIVREVADPEFADFIKLIIDMNRNLGYRYIGVQSQKAVDIVFPPAELRSIVR